MKPEEQELLDEFNDVGWVEKPASHVIRMNENGGTIQPDSKPALIDDEPSEV